MAKRQSTFRVDSAEIQGEGSYVVLRHIPYGLVSAAGRKATQDAVTPEEEDEFVRDLIAKGVVEWDWVDDEGTPLPTPAAGLDLDELLAHEVQFLVNQLTGATPAKN